MVKTKRTKLDLLKAGGLLAAVMLFMLTVTACKKDKLIVNETKVYSQAGHVPADAYDGGWQLTLQPDGVADVNPGGDIYYRGIYKINGGTVKVETPQNSATYSFKIISDSEIEEKQYGVRLTLKQ